MRNVIITLIIILSSLLSQAFAADWQGGLYFTIGLPQGEFKENVDRTGFGLSGQMAWQPNPSVALGGALGVLIYGSETRYEPFSLTVPDVTVEVHTSNNFSFGNLLLQLRANLPIAKPYLEGRFGFNYLWTETSVEDVNSDYDVASSTNFDDITIAYGGGGGIMIQVWEQKKRKRSRTMGGTERVYIDLKVLYMLGGNAEYLREGDIERHTDGTVTYYYSESKTDILDIHIGVAAEF